MQKEKNITDRPKLRRLAEDALEAAPDDRDEFSGMSPKDMAGLIHELRVHQIELKMQNEELRCIQLELEKTQNRYSHLYDFSPVGYFSISEKGIVEAANLTIASMLKVNRGALIGKPLTQFVLKDDQDIYYKHRQRLLETEAPQVCELRFVKKDGHAFYVRLECMIVNSKEEDLREIRAAVSDIAESKRAEKDRDNLRAKLIQSQKMESIGTLAGGIAHNFNNMLMGIQGRASLMMMDKDPSHPDCEHLYGIENCVISASELTRDLLCFARGGKYEIKSTDLNALIKRVNRNFGRMKKEIRVHGKYEKKLWPAEADRDQIQQALLHLYVNAWQAMSSGGNLYVQTDNITIDEAYIKPFEVTPGRYVKISVTDTGTGMDDVTREKIFDPFFSTRDAGQSFGLGLASVYGIVKNHGGFIDVYSKKGEGSTFNIHLPASEKELREEGPELERYEIQYGQGTILLVDDEDMIIEVGQKILENLGYRVLIAKSGREALDVYGKQRDEIDLVILDMIMPAMGGGETYDRMKDIDEGVSVLLTSGYSIEGQAKEIMDRGCKGFIQKPFSITNLSNKVRKALE